MDCGVLIFVIIFFFCVLIKYLLNKFVVLVDGFCVKVIFVLLLFFIFLKIIVWILMVVLSVFGILFNL